MEKSGELQDKTGARLLQRPGIANAGFRPGTSPYVITLDSGAKLFLTQRQADIFPPEWPED